MTARQRLVKSARATYSRMPESSRKAIPQGLRTKLKTPPAAKKPANSGLLSVVMPVYNVEAYLDEAVQSVLGQSHAKLELILVDDGSTDSSGDMCETIAATDKRVRVIHKANAGLGAARNTGTLAARGEFLTYVDSDDIILDRAYERMVKSLKKTGSDLVTGNVVRQQGGRRWQAWNQSRSHTHSQSKITVRDNPDLIFDAVAWNKVFRRAFWMENVATFPEAKLYEDMVPILTAFLRAGSVDVLKQPVYAWRQRDEGGSITQRRAETRNLTDKLEMISIVAQLIDDSPYADVLHEAFYSKTIGGDLWIYIQHIDGASDEFVSALEAASRIYWLGATDPVKSSQPQERRIQFQLLAEGRGCEVARVRTWFAKNREALPIVREDGSFFMDRSKLPLQPRLQAEWLYLLDDKVTAKATITDLQWTDDDHLSVHGYGYVPFVTDGTHTIDLVARHIATDSKIVIPTVRTASLDGAHWASDVSQPHDHDGFIGIVDPEAFVHRDHDGVTLKTTWEFEVRITHGDVERSVPADNIWRGGAAVVISAKSLPDGSRAVPRTEANHPLRLQIMPSLLRASHVALAGTKLTLSFDGESAPLVDDVYIRNNDRAFTLHAEEKPSTAGRTFVAFLPVMPDLHWTTWRVKAEVGGVETPVLIDSGFALPHRTGEESLVLETNRWGDIIVTGRNDTARIEQLEFTPESTLRLSGNLLGLSNFEVALTSGADEPREWVTPSTGPGTFVVELPLTKPDWYGIERSLHSGTFNLAIRRTDVLGAGRPAEISITDAAAMNLPLHHDAPLFRAQIDRAKLSRLKVSLSSPVPREDLGRYAQKSLREKFGSGAEIEPEDAVFFYVDMGANAADSALAIHNELLRTESGLTPYWGVDDFSVCIPPGGVPVLKGSRTWFEKLARSRFIVNNYGGIYGYEDRPHQKYLQTWHGTPFKFVGTSEARKMEAEPARFDDIEAEARQWDAFISPSPYFTDLIETEFLYQGNVLESGYPRNDSLVAPGDEECASLRGRLGLEPDAKVLLYAPTFRDRLRSGWSAAMFDELDLDQLAARLGDEWTILLRGHSFNARRREADRSNARIVDVTHHHNVNDLYLVADVLVTDYSSVMFDFAVTGKPMLFFVPDLDEYVASRGSYFELGDHAPGARCTELDEVVGHLRDLPGYQRLFADRHDEFCQKFVPWDDGKAARRVVEAFFE